MRFLYEFVQQTLKLQFGEDFGEACRVRLLKFQRVEVEVDRNVGSDGGKELRHAYIVNGSLHLLAQLALYLCRVLKYGVDASKLGDELGGSLRSHAGASGEVVGGVAHQCQEVYHLSRGVELVLLAHLLRSHRLVASAVTWAEDEDIVAHQLTVVFVGREHIGLHTGFASLRGKRADYVVRLEAVRLEHGDVHRRDDVLDDRYGGAYVLRCGFALRLVRRECLVAECLAVVERHTDVRGLLLGEYLVERVHEAHNS